MTRGLLWLLTCLNDIKTFHETSTCVGTPYTLIFQDLDRHTETLYVIQIVRSSYELARGVPERVCGSSEAVASQAVRGR